MLTKKPTAKHLTNVNTINKIYITLFSNINKFLKKREKLIGLIADVAKLQETPHHVLVNIKWLILVCVFGGVGGWP